MKKTLITLIGLVMVLAMKAQMVDPVHFTAELKTGSGAEAEIVFHATIDKGWHVYSTEIGEDGPIEATFNVVKMEGAELVGKLTPKGHVIKKMDKLFDMELKYFEGEATFVQKIRFTKPEYDIDCYLEYGACSDASCLPPSEVALKQSGQSPIISDKGKANSEKEGADKKEIKEDKKEIEEESGQTSDPLNAEERNTDSASVISLTSDASPLTSETDLWAPVVDELQSLGSIPELTNGSHSLLFRAWDVLNNSSVSRLSFVVSDDVSSGDVNVICTKNPAWDQTTFIITQSMAGSDMDVVMDVFDLSGRQLYKRELKGAVTDGVSVLNWNLSLSGGSLLHTGVYLCRFTVGGASKTVKLIVLKQ